MARITLKTSKVYNAEAFRRRPETIRNSMSFKEMRAEYRALKDVANKRLARIERNDETARYKGLEQFTKYGGFPSVQGLNAESLSVQLARLGDFLKFETSTAAGQRKADLAKMAELKKQLNIEFKSRKAFWQFVDYMEYVRQNTLKALYSSEQVVDNVFGTGEEFSELSDKEQQKRIKEAYEHFRQAKLEEAKIGEMQRLGENGERVKETSEKFVKAIKVMRVL